jgi:tetratricopeptide (TPR) repeat protein
MKRVSFFLVCTLVFGFSLGLMAQEETPSAASLYNDGLSNLKAKDYEAALGLFEQALETADPEADEQVVKLAKRNGAIAAYYVATEQRKGEEFEAAAGTYQKGIDMAPNFYANHMGLGQALEGADKPEEALTAFLKAADLAEKTKKADKAEKVYSKSEAMIAKAYVAKDWDRTQRMANTFLAQKETADVHYYLSGALRKSNVTDKAIEHAQKALELASEGQDKYQFGLAQAYEAAGQTSNAISAYEKITSGKYAERAQYQAKQLSGN